MEHSTPVRSQMFLEKEITQNSASCPTSVLDIEENIKNRNWTIDNFAYGPLNPDHPDPGFWERKADMWNTDIQHAQSALCGNCAAFDQSQRILECIVEGINETKAADPHDVQNLADLGYCQLFKFKCASQRTCDAWLHGGPIQ